MSVYTEQYEKRVLATKNGLAKYEEKLKREQELFENEQEPKRKQLRASVVARTQNSVDFYKSQLKIFRPPTQEDINYRENVRQNFSREVRSVLPKDCPVCFHGTRYGNIESILKSGGLASSVDRLGYSTSYDVEDQVSVTVVNTLETTINGYTGLNSYEEPAGCVFLVLPKDEAEYKSSRSSMIIGNVDFRKEPERLVGILSTPENVEQIKSWCEKYDIACNPNNICTFGNFLERVKQKYNANSSEKGE